MENLTTLKLSKKRGLLVVGLILAPFLLLSNTSLIEAEETNESAPITEILEKASEGEAFLPPEGADRAATMAPVTGLTYGADVRDFWKPYFENPSGQRVDIPDIITANNTYKGKLTRQTTKIYLKGKIGHVQNAVGGFFDQYTSEYSFLEGGGTTSGKFVKSFDFTADNLDFSKTKGATATWMWSDGTYSYKLINIPFFIPQDPALAQPTNLSKTLSGTGEPLFNFTITAKRNGQDVEIAKGAFDANGEFKDIPITAGLPLIEKEVLSINSYDAYNMQTTTKTVTVAHEGLPTSPTIESPVFPTALTGSKTISGTGTFPKDGLVYRIYDSNGTTLYEEGRATVDGVKKWSVVLQKDLLANQKIEVSEIDPYDGTTPTGVVSTVVHDAPVPMVKFDSVKPLVFETKSLDELTPDGYIKANRLTGWGMTILDTRNATLGGDWSVLVSLKDDRLVSTTNPSHVLNSPIYTNFGITEIPVMGKQPVLSSSKTSFIGKITSSQKGQKQFTKDVSFASEDIGFYLKVPVNKVYAESYTGTLEFTLSDVPSR